MIQNWETSRVHKTHKIVETSSTFSEDEGTLKSTGIEVGGEIYRPNAFIATPMLEETKSIKYIFAFSPIS